MYEQTISIVELNAWAILLSNLVDTVAQLKRNMDYVGSIDYGFL